MKTSITTKAFGILAGICLTPFLSGAQCLTSVGPTNNCSYGDAIDILTINGNTVSNSGCSGSGTGYTFFPTPVWNFSQGASYPITVTVGGGQYNQGVMIWIDFDGNNQFDVTDVAYTSGTPAFTHTGTLTIPAVTTLGTVRMRVMCTYNVIPTPGQACSSNVGNYGETEDYDVVLGPSTLADDVEATSVEAPMNNSCGLELDTVTVRVTNLGTNVANNVPVQLDVTGAITGTFNATIPSIAVGSFEDVDIAVLDTRDGGALNFVVTTTMAGDANPTNDVLNAIVTKINSTDLVISGQTDLCEGETVTLSCNDLPGETYTWSEGGGPTSNGTTFTLTPTVSTSVTVSSDNTCRLDGMVLINIIPAPTISFTSTPTSGTTVDFLAVGTDFNSVLWDFGDGGTSTTPDPTYSYAANGTYFVCVTAANDCDTVTYCDSVLVSDAGLAVLGFGDVTVFPNPSSDIVHVDFAQLNGFTGGWVLVDMEGKTLASGELAISSAKHTMTISLGSYAPGNYIIKVKGSAGEEFKVNLVRN